MRFTSVKDVSANLITTAHVNVVVETASKVARLCYLLVISLAKYANERLA